MNKSLTPLIIVFAIVITLIVVMLNWDMPKRPQENLTEMKYLAHDIKLKKTKLVPNQIKKTTIIEDASAFNINARLKIIKVRRLFKEHKIKEAEDLLRTILVFEPNNINAMILLGNILFRDDRLKEAEDLFKHGIRVAPLNYIFYNNLASIFAKENKLDKGILMAKKAFHLNKRAPNVNLTLSGMYSLKGQKRLALLHFKKAADIYAYAIVSFSKGNTFDNIRNESEFIEIIKNAKSMIDDQENDKKLKTFTPVK